MVQLTDQQTAEHNKLYRQALAIVESEIPLHDRPPLPRPGWWLRHRLKRAISLFERVLSLEPENWSAMWLAGKVYERLGDSTTALSWFDRAYQVNPSQRDVAREASLCAMDIGHCDTAVTYASRATEMEPDSAGLHANLALAYLLAGRIDEALGSIERSLVLDPSDMISQTLRTVIQHFVANGNTPPTTTAGLEQYCRKNDVV